MLTFSSSKCSLGKTKITCADCAQSEQLQETAYDDFVNLLGVGLISTVIHESIDTCELDSSVINKLHFESARP